MPVLNLGLGGVCDYRCSFCSRGKDHYFDGMIFNPRDEYEKAIEQLSPYSKRRDPGHLIISRDEPINHPFLKNVISFARKAGFRKISLSTAGMGLKNRKFLAGLVKAGVTSVVLPVYGVTPAVHDGIVGLPGAHGVLCRVIAALGRMKVETRFTTVILRQNLKEIEALVKRYACAVFFPYPISSRISYENLCVRLSEIPEGIRRSLNLNIPCITGKTWREKMNGRINIHTVPMNLPYSGHTTAPYKPKKCRRCGAYEECEGISREYAALYGSGEFKPLRGSGLSRG